MRTREEIEKAVREVVEHRGIATVGTEDIELKSLHGMQITLLLDIRDLLKGHKTLVCERCGGEMGLFDRDFRPGEVMELYTCKECQKVKQQFIPMEHYGEKP